MNLKGHFWGKLQVEYIDGILWKVINPTGEFGFALDDGRKVIPPYGYITNFASIPRLLQNILPAAGTGPKGKYGPGAVCHDLVYETGQIDGKNVSRHEADHLLKACNEAMGVDPIITGLIHDGLVLGGGPTWEHYRKGGSKIELMSCHEWVNTEIHKRGDES